MKNEILDHYGAVISAPIPNKIYYTVNYVSKRTAKIMAYEGISASSTPYYWASRKAAKMEIIRADCIRRLKEMAYGDGIPKDFDNTYTISILRAFGSLGSPSKSRAGIVIDAYFKEYQTALIAFDSIIDKEKSAFLYVYKPEEE